MTPLFQSNSRTLALLRDLTFNRLKWLPWLHREMLRTLAGLKTGLFASASAQALAGSAGAAQEAPVDALIPMG